MAVQGAPSSGSSRISFSATSFPVILCVCGGGGGIRQKQEYLNASDKIKRKSL